MAAVEEEGESHVIIHVRFLVPTHYAPLALVSTTASAPRLWEDALYLRASEVILVLCDPRTLCVLVDHGRDLTLVPAPTSVEDALPLFLLEVQWEQEQEPFSICEPWKEGLQ